MPLTSQQKELRSTGIGASEIAAVAGLSPWKGPHQIWEEKLGIAPPREDTEATRWGRYLEPAIIALWKAETGHKVKYANRHQRTLRHPTCKIALATPDGIVDPDATLEVKTYGWRMAEHWGEEGTDDIPEYYMAQVQWAMACAQKQKCYVVANCERKIETYVVNFVPALFNALYEIAERFWTDHLVKLKPPPVDHTERCTQFLQRYYPKPLDKTMAEPSRKMDRYAQEIRDAQMMIESAQKKITEAKNHMMDYIGSNYGVETDQGKVLWYNCKGKKTIDGKGLLSLAKRMGASDEELAEYVTRGANYRVFRGYWRDE